MYVSKETPTATTQRLQHVLAAAKWQVYAGSYVFLEFPLGSTIPVETQLSSFSIVGVFDVWCVLNLRNEIWFD